ncbi:hypothetical protein BaRGS_00025236 [Batillaria attramentaria]|uniref:Nucleoside-diphosphate kinase n=1 Tax=Batillaria attramentaria TaxID=370345 RepID=A0ABD0K8Z6_9CAEN
MELRKTSFTTCSNLHGTMRPCFSVSAMDRTLSLPFTVIQNIADARPKVRYIIAKDDAQNTLEELSRCVHAVSGSLGTGKVKMITKEEAPAEQRHRELYWCDGVVRLQQADFDQLLVNLRMDAVFVKENMRIPWVSEAGLVENILKVIKEYKDSRNLQPLRAVILGPPAVGKTPSFSSCVKFTSFTIKPRRVVLTLKTKTKRTMGQAQEAQEILDQINESKEQNGGRMEDQFVIRFFRNRLKSMPCQNQGFILDGYPKTLEQAKDLFALDDEEEAEEGKPSFDQTIMPEFVISLEATDEFLRSRVMHLPEAMVAGTHNTEKELMRRLADYRVINTEEETVLNYFDELEFHPERIDVTTDTSPNMKDTVEKIKKIMKSPRNYGPTPEELAEMQRQEEETPEEATERKRKQEEWSQRLNEVKREEYELLEAQSVPLRNYLMQHVMPTMTQALIDCCKSRPDDPIDYIAEYLFQHNPQVD